MGSADLVPGISGGTVAFLTGIYSHFLGGIASVNKESLKLLFTGQFRAFNRAVPWQFLGTLLFAMACAILSLSNLVKYALHNEPYRTYLFASFFGFILASMRTAFEHVQNHSVSVYIWMIIGALIAYFMNWIPPMTMESHGEFDPRIIVSGGLAICAMLLPGISGSSLLVLLGVYPVVISNIADFSMGLRSGIINWPAVSLLSQLALGIFVGAIFASRAILWLLEKYPCRTMGFLIGLMGGALAAVWPGTTVETVGIALLAGGFVWIAESRMKAFA